jgi:catalase
VDSGGEVLLNKANVNADKGVINVSEIETFISLAKTRLFDREKSIRTLA